MIQGTGTADVLPQSRALLKFCQPILGEPSRFLGTTTAMGESQTLSSKTELSTLGLERVLDR